MKTIRMETNDAVAAVRDYFVAQMNGAGWQITNQSKLSIQAKKTHRILSINVLSHRDSNLGQPVELAIQYN